MSTKDKRLENLKPFKKGADPRRNVTGANRKLPEEVEELAEVLADDSNAQKITAIRAIYMRLRQKALAGDFQSAAFLIERAYGKARQPIEMSKKRVIKVRVGGKDAE